MAGTIEKVTAFITRRHGDADELLVFEHPFAGIQLPAGTVEPGEPAEAAALREAQEETGLTGFTGVHYLGSRDELGATERVIQSPTTVYARPDPDSFDWARLPRGITVTLEQDGADFSLVTYAEDDDYLRPQYVTYRITGWVPNTALADRKLRHFVQLEYAGPSAASWEVAADKHRFRPFWAPLTALPAIVPPQDTWLTMLPRRGDDAQNPADAPRDEHS